jgi:hypothetical protein
MEFSFGYSFASEPSAMGVSELARELFVNLKNVHLLSVYQKQQAPRTDFGGGPQGLFYWGL